VNGHGPGLGRGLALALASVLAPVLMLSAGQAQAQAPSVAAVSPHLRWLPEMLAQHPLAQSAEQQRLAARQELQSAQWQFFPTPSLGMENSNQTNPNLDSQYRFARLQQPLWTGGRLTAQRQRAEAQQEATQASWQEQRQTLALRWLELWAETCAARARMAAYADSAAQHERYVDFVRARAQQGLIAVSESNLSLARLAGVRADHELAKVQWLQARSRLQQMLPGGWIEQADLGRCVSAASAPSFSDLSQLQLLAEKHSPAFRRVLVGVQVLQSDIELAKSRFSPEVYARLEASHGNVTQSVQKGTFGFATQFGAGLSNANAVGAAQNRLDAQRQEVEARRKDLRDQVATDFLQHQGLGARRVQIMQAFEASDAYLQSSENQFRTGRRSWQEVMNNARERTQWRIQLVDLDAQMWLIMERMQVQAQGLDPYIGSL